MQQGHIELIAKWAFKRSQETRGRSSGEPVESSQMNEGVTIVLTATVFTATVVLPAILAALSLVALQLSSLRIFRRLPLLSFYSNAMQAIEKLEGLDADASSRGTRVGVVSKGDVGFKELCQILRENRMFKIGLDEGTVDKIILEEEHTRGGFFDGHPNRGGRPLTATLIRTLKLARGEQSVSVQEERFDSVRTTKNLADRLETIVRRRLAYAMLVVLAAWLALNTYLQVWIYLDL